MLDLKKKSRKLKMARKNTIEDFYTKYTKAPGCWEWNQSTDSYGYGQFKLDGTVYLAHRFAWMIHTGIDIRKHRNVCVCHKCDNPRCLNPKHLFLGTVRDNIRDRVLKKRCPNTGITHCKHGHEFTKENTRYSINIRGNQRRACKTCNRVRTAKWQETNK